MLKCVTHQNCTGALPGQRDHYPALWSYLRRPLSGLSPRSRGERRIKRCRFAADTAEGAAIGTKSNAKAERKCQIFALLTTLFSGSTSPRRVGWGSSQYLFPSSPVATHFHPLSATMPRGMGVTRPGAGATLSRALCACPWHCALKLRQHLCVAIPLDALCHHAEEVIA